MNLVVDTQAGTRPRYGRLLRLHLAVAGAPLALALARLDYFASLPLGLKVLFFLGVLSLLASAASAYACLVGMDWRAASHAARRRRGAPWGDPREDAARFQSAVGLFLPALAVGYADILVVLLLALWLG